MKDFEKQIIHKNKRTGGMRLIASKRLNHRKNSEQLGTTSKRLSMRKRLSKSLKKSFNQKQK